VKSKNFKALFFRLFRIIFRNPTPNYIRDPIRAQVMTKKTLPQQLKVGAGFFHYVFVSLIK